MPCHYDILNIKVNIKEHQLNPSGMKNQMYEQTQGFTQKIFQWMDKNKDLINLPKSIHTNNN